MIFIEYNRHAGLGNKLFPFSRAIVASKLTGLPVVDPIWFSPRGAGLIRGGVDMTKALRKIWLYGNFRPIPQSRSTFHGMFSGLPVEYVSNLPDFTEKYECLGASVSYIFRWNSHHHFDDLIVHRGLIREVLFSLSKPILPDCPTGEFCAINMRLGRDFVAHDDDGTGYRRNPDNFWQSAFSQVFMNEPVSELLVISDGTEREIRSFFSSNVNIANNQYAIQDLWMLANASVIVGTGNSSFSAWGGFLSNAKLYGSTSSKFDSYGLDCFYL